MTSHVLNVLLLATLAITAFVVYSKVFDGPAHTDPAIPIPYTSKEGVVMSVAVKESVKPAAFSFGTHAIPPIDAAVPSKIETATFAMG